MMSRISQPRPARVEVFTKADESQQLAVGYQSVELTSGVLTARAEIPVSPGVSFRLQDHWSISGAVISVRRRLEVKGGAPGGFYSAVILATQPEVTWPEIDFLAPALLYGDTAHDGDRSPGGTLNYISRRFGMREDWLPAPLFALHFRDGNSIAVLDPSPRGDTTAVESHAEAGTALIDSRFQFGALGANESADGGVEFGFWLPGTTREYIGPVAGSPVPAWRRRGHPIQEGLVQNYEVAFRFGQGEKFSDVTRDAYRWAWEMLQPAVTYIDVPMVRRTLIEFLADRVITVDGRTGIPYLLDTRTGKPMARADATRAAMGFCAKNLEAADQLLREGDRDPGPRGQRMRKLGLEIIDTFIWLIPMSPPAGDGFDLYTGKLTPAVWSVGQQFIRPPTEALLVVLQAYRRERSLGREHPEWLRWCLDLGDWLLTQQRPDGSFPRSWKPGTSEVVNPSGSATYSPPPLLVALSQETGQAKYLESAIRAGEYLWATDGIKGLFHGGSIDASSVELVTDGEAGHLAFYAFLSLYEATHQTKWLERAKVAADFTESWIWLWNVPMPDDESDQNLHWKKEVPTTGYQSITVRTGGTIHVHLAWAMFLYAKLYEYTKDAHYLDVARILLHDTKAMLSLPGRTYSMPLNGKSLELAPGWVQEHWNMGPGRMGRGYGQPGKWLTWLVTVHLYPISRLEEDNPGLFRLLSEKPAVLGNGMIGSARQSGGK